MKKIIKYLMFVLIACVAVACSKDDNENQDSEGGNIVGTWVCKNFDEGVSFTMCFKSNGTGWMEWSDDDDRHTFEYTTKNGKIYFADDYDYWTCDYTIKGSKLTIYGNPWGEDDDVNVITLTKK